MSALTLFHLAGRWLALDNQKLVDLPENPNIDSPCVVISDLNNAVSGVMAMEGASSMAAPLIEKRLRREGLTDGESHVEIAHNVSLGNGFRAVYTAVPMDAWQNLLTWSDSNNDHRVIVPLLKVAQRLVKPGVGVVIRHGRQAFFLSINGKSATYAEAIAYSNDAEGIEAGVAALSDRVRASLISADGPRSVIWCALDASINQNEEALSAAFSTATGLSVSMAPHQNIVLSDGTSIRSCAQFLANSVHVSDAVAPNFAAPMVYAERALPWAAIAAAIIAGFFAYQGLQLSNATAQRDLEAAQLRSETQNIQQTLSAKPVAVTHEDILKTRAFVERLQTTNNVGDLTSLTASIRQSSAELVHILRIRLDAATGSYVVEGVMRSGTNAEGELSRFVDKLRTQGLNPVALATPAGNQIAGYFSYAIKRTAANSAGVAP